MVCGAKRDARPARAAIKGVVSLRRSLWSLVAAKASPRHCDCCGGTLSPNDFFINPASVRRPTGRCQILVQPLSTPALPTPLLNRAPSPPTAS